jgi:hypothetical protein
MPSENRGAGGACAAAFLLALSPGCASLDLIKPPPRTDVYPAALAPGAPLVFAIPGLRVPGLRITQEEHFGRLVELLAAEGIPCRILAYDTPEDPATRDAALYSPDHGLAWTRVGPAMAREFESENERRASRGAPPVRRIVLIGYSQGAVLMEQLARRVFRDFRDRYDKTVEGFGPEWEALQKDPEFVQFVSVLDDFVALDNIKTQYEEIFRRSPSLRRFYERMRKKLAAQHAEFLVYLADPAEKYPGVKRFEPVGSPYYPKRYDRIRAYAAERGSRSEEEKVKNREFFVTYAQYRGLLGVEARFVTCAGSLFGSPQANDALNLVRWMPLARRFIIGREYFQIEQTELGAAQHIRRVEALAAEARGRPAPAPSRQELSIVGANGSEGDGFVDQPAAHLSMHTFAVYRTVDGGGGRPRLERTELVTLPEVPVVPLRLSHFAEKRLGGYAGRRYGAAYMVADNPAWPHLLGFIRGERATPGTDLSIDSDLFRQFMIEVTLGDSGLRESDVRWDDASDNVVVRGRYYNRGSRTIVWTGYFKEKGVVADLKEKARLLDMTDMLPGVRDVFGTAGSERPRLLQNLRRHAQLLNPVPLLPRPGTVLGWTGLSFEEAAGAGGEARFTVRLAGGEKAALACAVHPGRISFVKIEAGPAGGPRQPPRRGRGGPGDA